MPLLQGLGITILIAFLFYRSIIGMLVGVFIIPFWWKLKQQEMHEKRVARIALEFKEYMMLIVSGLQAGYSLERAVKQGEEELVKLYPKDSVLAGPIHIMNRKLTMNVQLEKAFDEFAREIELEEAISLSEIISFAKRSGGDYGRHIRETALKIEDNLSIKQEIETITTEKRLELKVMSVMPMGILAYISLTSESFIAPLYGNPLGAAVMTVCLLAYGFCISLGKRIIDIKV
ncbi:type II secretion system F family protein [Pseudobutyrivibrio sp. YE44]|uniref:type II secretion system F family protein n=1 Tax=Pseudobutyrivibrio sp. YE44 TaxID=1520802 RepID=UPI000A4D816A|nr:hypothetical protein [Pseudobutyrivibrio sp. YE44]